ncbi:MAG: IPT/TIG domain-containing protein, partial [Candidatus Methylomirabilis sp.]|nr:IPT/TIG domain-containing protein [Deltaproteobacteria bacterium]
MRKPHPFRRVRAVFVAGLTGGRYNPGGSFEGHARGQGVTAISGKRALGGLLAIWGALLVGCPGPSVTGVSPDTSTQFGHIEVTISGGGFTSGAKAFVGGVEALYPTVVDAGTMTATIQGSPVPGLADVRVVNPDNQSATLAASFTFTPPVDPLFEKVYALGASFSAGIQSNSFSGRAQLTGPVAQIMRAAGAYFPMPIT